MAKLYVTIDGWNEREDARELNVALSVWEHDIGASIKAMYQASGDPPRRGEISGEYKIDDGPWLKWRAEPEWDYHFNVRAEGM